MALFFEVLGLITIHKWNTAHSILTLNIYRPALVICLIWSRGYGHRWTKTIYGNRSRSFSLHYHAERFGTVLTSGLTYTFFYGVHQLPEQAKKWSHVLSPNLSQIRVKFESNWVTERAILGALYKLSRKRKVNYKVLYRLLQIHRTDAHMSIYPPLTILPSLTFTRLQCPENRFRAPHTRVAQNPRGTNIHRSPWTGPAPYLHDSCKPPATQ